MFSHTLSKILYDKGLSSETKWFYVETEITGSDEEDDNFSKNGIPDDFTLQYLEDGLDGAIPAFNFLDILNKENAVKLFPCDVGITQYNTGEKGLGFLVYGEWQGMCTTCKKKFNGKAEIESIMYGHKNCPKAAERELYKDELHELLDLYLSGGEQAVEAKLVEMLISKT